MRHQPASVRRKRGSEAHPEGGSTGAGPAGSTVEQTCGGSCAGYEVVSRRNVGEEGRGRYSLGVGRGQRAHPGCSFTRSAAARVKGTTRSDPCTARKLSSVCQSLASLETQLCVDLASAAVGRTYFCADMQLWAASTASRHKRLRQEIEYTK